MSESFSQQAAWDLPAFHSKRNLHHGGAAYMIWLTNWVLISVHVISICGISSGQDTHFFNSEQ